MANINIDIPEVQIENDFTIIYKGMKHSNNEKEESIIEIKTSRDKFLQKLRYFKGKSNEIKLVNEYYIHDVFDQTIFTNFINSLISNKIELNDQNYLDYYKLSNKYEYCELSQSIEKFISTRPDLQLILQQILNPKDTNDDENEKVDFEKETLIAKNLDFFLENGSLSKFSFASISRIINSPHRILRNHHLLFKFVQSKIKEIQKMENFKETDKMNFDILIGALDFNEMTSNEIEEFLNQDLNGICIQPRNSNEMMKSVFEMNKKNEERIEKLENYLNQQNKENEQTKNKIEMIERKLEEQSKLISEYQNALLKYVTIEKVNEIEKQRKTEEEEIKNTIKFQMENIDKIQMKQEEIEKSMKQEENHGKNENNIPVLFHEFEGVINYLINQSHDNYNEYINVSASSTENKDLVPQNAILYNNDSKKYFASENKINSWFCIEFIKHQINPKNYTLKTYSFDKCHPKSWVIEGTNNKNDEKSWEILDEQKDCDILNGMNISHTFSIHNPTNKTFQFLRMRETGKNWRNDNFLCFKSIEFYGYLKNK